MLNVVYLQFECCFSMLSLFEHDVSIHTRAIGMEGSSETIHKSEI